MRLDGAPALALWDMNVLVLANRTQIHHRTEHQRNPNASKFEDRSQEETEWQERCSREAAWRLAKNIPKILRRTIKQHSSHLRK